MTQDASYSAAEKGTFCARVVFWHVVPTDALREATVGQNPTAPDPNPHLHTRTCTTVHDLVNVLREARIREHLVHETSVGERFSARSFFWVDMHGVPPHTEGPSAVLDELWELLGLHPTTVQHMNRVLDARTVTPPHGMTETVFHEVDMDEPDTAHLLPLSHAGVGNYYYVAMQIATVMEHNRPGTTPNLHWTNASSPYTATADTALHPFAGPAQESAAGRHRTCAADVELNARDNVTTDHRHTRALECRDVGDDGQPHVLRQTMVTTTHVLCFPQGCLTWCPSSTVAAETEAWASHEPMEVMPGSQHVKDWDKLQEAVFSYLQRNTPAAFTTADFVSLMLSTMCYGYLPDTTAALSEVDTIDASLLTVVPEHERQQALALHSVLLQRRKLSLLRKLLFRKLRLLEQLDKPAMRTLAGFMSSIAPRTTHMKRAQADTHFALSTYDTVVQLVRKLDTARIVLGNLTLVYTSAVTTRNSRSSINTDVYMLILQYMIIVVLPLSMIASHWGMNCNVPWNDVSNLKPFWGLLAFMLGCIVITLIYPTWAYNTRRFNLIM